MDLYEKYKSPLGYEIGDDGVDSYGVNHRGFSTRDELEYQMARQQREQQLMQNYNSQGITQDYPQYGTNFWGDNTDNNYGFGSSNIGGNVKGIMEQFNGINYTITPDYTISPVGAMENNNLVSASSVQTAQNIPSIENRSVDYYFNRDKADLCANEGGFIPYAYLDTANPTNTTIGCGINVDQTPDVQLYNARTGQPFSKEELQKAIQKLKQEAPGKIHTYYEDKSDIRIAPSENERIMKNKYVDGYNYVTSKYTSFPNYSENRQKALMDMAYGLGVPRFSKYTNMQDAILHNDWQKAANEAWRCGVDLERNQKTVNQMYSGLDIDKMKKEHCQNGKKK
ncbi:MAG: hypothetical protein IJ532_08325 [Alphaproteobacteria bacterium]|nr:hypothetical protein [Alphaproteobacteria bacterium]